MTSASRISIPRSRFVRWLASVDDRLPAEVQERLLASFFTSSLALVMAHLNALAVACVAFARIGDPVLLVVAVCDVALLAFRVVLLRHPARPIGLLLISSVVWAALLSTTIAVVVSSGDVAMSLIALASGLASIGGIVGRNFAAPRCAMAQTLVIDLSFKVSFCLQQPEFLPLIVVQTMLFVLMNVGLIMQHRRATIRALLGEIESRMQSLTDPLTGLLNRRGLEAEFLARRAEGRPTRLLYLDLDNFKGVNDLLGHGCGDSLLQQAATRLREAAGPRAAVCRLGGDEFLVLADVAQREDLLAFGARIVAALSTPYTLDEHPLVRVGVSVGGVLSEDAGQSLPAMMKQADEALYEVKSHGKGRCVVGRPQATEPARRGAA